MLEHQFPIMISGRGRFWCGSAKLSIENDLILEKSMPENQKYYEADIKL